MDRDYHTNISALVANFFTDLWHASHADAICVTGGTLNLPGALTLAPDSATPTK